MNFNIRQKGRKSNGDKSMMRLVKSPTILVSGTSNTNFYQPIMMNFVIE